jgi:3-isopropylmalate/(R)-2-methylmalate dehydratase large subunit
VLEEMGIKKLNDPKKIQLFLDHTFPAADPKVANMHKMMREFSKKHGIELTEGSISHQHVHEKHATSGMLILGADSHTCQAGCVGAFASGIGSTEIASVWASGKIWLKIPESFKINVTGKLRKGVFSRDIILDYISQVGEDGGNYRSLEWEGDTIRKLTMDSRAALCNQSMECGAKNSVITPDNVTRKYLRSVRRKPVYEIHSGKKSEYLDEFEMEAKNIYPIVVKPGNMDNGVPVSELEGTEFDQAFIGSATNGRIEDLEIAARILKGRKIKNCRCVITPTSKTVYEEAIKRGYVKIFMDAGAVFTNATCGACVGTHLGALGNKEICISSSSRNFTGRMGDMTSKIYIASPATVAASAVAGKIADPKNYL